MKPLTQKLYQEYFREDDSSGEGEEPKYWGREAAGCIFVAKDTGRILLAKRKPGVMEPNTWGTWGGKMDWEETPEETVIREVDEEVGYEGKYTLSHLWTYRDPDEGFAYHNYLALVPTQFTPKLNWENQNSKWVEYGEWPTPLHFGLAALIQYAGPKIKRVVNAIKKKNAKVIEVVDVQVEKPSIPKVKLKSKNTKPKEAIREALESDDPHSSAIIKIGIVGDGIYEYEMKSPFSRVRYLYEPSRRLFYLENIATPDVKNQGKGYAKALLESFFMFIKHQGGELDCDTYTTSGETKIKHVVEYLSKKYRVMLVNRKEDHVGESGDDDFGVILGAIDFHGENMDPMYSPNQLQRHSPEMNASRRKWRYYIDLEQLDWFGTPKEEEHEKTKLFLKQMGYNVERVNIIPPLTKENKLLMESFKEWNSKYWTHYSDVDYLKIRASTLHYDLAAIYLFPYNFISQDKHSNAFFKNKKYKLTVQVNEGIHILDWGGISIKGFQDILTQLGHDKEFTLLYNTQNWSGKSGGYTLEKHPHKLMWRLLGHIFNGRPLEWNKAFRKMGYDAIFDDTGAMWEGEPQLIILDESKVKVVNTENNSP